MAQTDLDLANLAIGRCGGEAIEAFNDDTPLSAFATVQWDAKKRWLLAKHRWIFADKLAQLQQVAAAPPGAPLPYAFTRPGDLGGAIHAAMSAPDARTGFKVQLRQLADFLYADCQTVWVEYTGGADVDTWPPWFAELAVTAFAVEVARLVLRRSLADELMIQAFGPPEMMGDGGLMLQAKQEDGRNAPERTLSYCAGGPLSAARFGVGVLAGPGGGVLGFPNNGFPFVIEVQPAS